MARIWFSLAGEGRGHATRVRTLVHALEVDHEIRIFTSGVAHGFLSSVFNGTRVEVTSIPGLLFQRRQERIDLPKTLLSASGYLRRLPRLVEHLSLEMRRGQPDLVVADFEPALPRAAYHRGVPVVGVDHQHVLVVSDFRKLPLSLRLYAKVMGAVVTAYDCRPKETVVSSFYFPDLRPEFDHVHQAGTLLRREILAARPSNEGHLLVYLRTAASSSMLEALASCGREVKVYGLGVRPRSGNLHFRPISEEEFLADLASCSAVVSNAGNQLLGEALFLEKPVLAIPEEGQHEQLINAHFLRLGGGGDFVRAAAFDDLRLKDFLTRLDRYGNLLDRKRICGNEVALAAIRRHLPRAVTERADRVAACTFAA